MEVVRRPAFSRTAMASVRIGDKRVAIVAIVLLVVFSGSMAGRSDPSWACQQMIGRKESGLNGTTSSRVLGGVLGGQVTERPTSLEFAIAPIEGGNILYEKATFVASDGQGQYRVVLTPGTYWIGAKSKAMDPSNYRLGARVLAET